MKIFPRYHLLDRRIALLCAAVFCLAAHVNAGSPFDSGMISVDSDGTFTIGGLPFVVVLYDATYVGDKQGSVKPDPGYPKITANRWEMAGVWSPKQAGDSFAFNETITRASDTSYKVSYKLKSSGAGPLNVPVIIACQTLLPADEYAQKAIAVDEQELPLAPSGGKPLSFDKWGSEQLMIPTSKGKLILHGDLKIHVQDDRPWQSEFFKIWFPLAQATQSLHEAELQLTFDIAPAAK